MAFDPISMISGMNKKPTRTKTTTDGSAEGQAAGQWGLDQMQANINAGPESYAGPNPYTDPQNQMQQGQTTTMNGIGTNLGGLQSQYGAPGGRFDQAYNVNQGVSGMNATMNNQVDRSGGPGGYQSGYQDEMMQGLRGDMQDAMKMAGNQSQTAFAKASPGTLHDRQSGHQAGMMGSIGSDFMKQATGIRQDAYNTGMQNMRQDSQDNMAANNANNTANMGFGNMQMNAADRMGDVSQQMNLNNAQSQYARDQGNVGNYQQQQQIAGDNWLQGNWQNGQDQKNNMMNQYMQGVQQTPWQGTTQSTGQGKSSMDQLIGIGTTAAGVKMSMACIPEGTEIDTPKGSVAIEDIKVGAKVKGYYSAETEVLQVHQYKEDPAPHRFYIISFDNGKDVRCCDMHKISGKRAKDYKVGDVVRGTRVVSITRHNGVERSYDLLTAEQNGGYMISNIPVNSMIEELADMVQTLKAA